MSVNVEKNVFIETLKAWNEEIRVLNLENRSNKNFLQYQMHGKEREEWRMFSPTLNLNILKSIALYCALCSNSANMKLASCAFFVLQSSFNRRADATS